ncbi:MAG TPA: hypothetical protein VML55_04970, partial [Planctomycetaceae bacterium]|nr:hypothetical protein [Planctomycetaceae bacterium]
MDSSSFCLASSLDRLQLQQMKPATITATIHHPKAFSPAEQARIDADQPARKRARRSRSCCSSCWFIAASRMKQLDCPDPTAAEKKFKGHHYRPVLTG